MYGLLNLCQPDLTGSRSDTPGFQVRACRYQGNKARCCDVGTQLRDCREQVRCGLPGETRAERERESLG